MADFSLSLDLVGALALFNLVDGRGSSAAPELDQVEAELRAYLYERLSIDEMEDPHGLYLKLRARRKGACETK